MNESVLPSQPTSPESTLLERLLAWEGRSALSRVELAASELARGQWAPVLADRIHSIREAVVELEGVFDRLERLANPAGKRRGEVTGNVGAAWQAVVARIAPTLETRGIALEPGHGEIAVGVAIPQPTLERLLLLALRVATATIARDERATIPGVAFVPIGRVRGAALEVELAIRGTTARIAAEPAARGLRLDLEVALAEWAGSVIVPAASDAGGLVLRLPRSDAHA